MHYKNSQLLQATRNVEIKQWKVKRDGGHFDQFTGATITPRAIVKAVHHCLLYFKQNQADLMQAANPQPKPDPMAQKVQAEIQIMQEKAKSEAQSAQVKAQSDARLRVAKLQEDQRQFNIETRQEQSKEMKDLAMKITELELTFNTQVDGEFKSNEAMLTFDPAVGDFV